MKSILFLAILILNIGCGKNVVERESFIPPNPAEKTIFSKNKIVEIRQAELSDFEKWKNDQLEVMSFEKINIPGNYNFELYQSSKKADRGKVFLLPRVKVLPSFESLYRMKRTQFGDGLEKIELPVVIVSGLQKEIFNQDQSEKAILSKEWLLKDKEMLSEILAEKLNSPVVFQTLNGCPDWIKLKSPQGVVEGKLEPYYSDVCHPDRPMKLTFILPQEDAQKLTEEEFNSERGVDLEILYKVGMNVKAGQYAVNIYLEQLHEQMEHNLKEKNFWKPGEANKQLYELLANELHSIKMDGVIDIPMKELSEKLGKLIFNSSDKGMALKYDISKDDVFTYEWQKLQKKFSQEKYSLKFTINDQTPFTQSYSIETDSTAQVYFLVGADDFVDLRINNLSKWQKVQIENSSQANNNICVESRKQCVNYEILDSGRRSCLTWKNICTREENQWTQHLDYSYKDGKYNNLGDWVSRFDELTKGLELIFEKDGNQFSCPLNSFSPRLTGETLMFRLQDPHNCPDFDPSFKDYILLIKNNLKISHQYNEGRLSKNWKSEIISREREITLMEKTRLEFSMRVRSYYMGNK